MFHHGVISFGGAATFSNKKLTRAQQDDELKRTFKPKGAQILSGPAPDKVSPLKNVLSVKLSLNISFPYYMKCFAMEYCEAHFDRFPGGACIRFENVAEFISRIDKALREQLPQWAAFAAKAEYADFKRLPGACRQFDLLFLKDADEYAEQGEYRVVLIPPEQSSDLPERCAVTIGPLTDIASISYRGKQTNS